MNQFMTPQDTASWAQVCMANTAHPEVLYEAIVPFLTVVQRPVCCRAAHLCQNRQGSSHPSPVPQHSRGEPRRRCGSDRPLQRPAQRSMLRRAGLRGRYLQTAGRGTPEHVAARSRAIASEPVSLFLAAAAWHGLLIPLVCLCLAGLTGQRVYP